MGNAGRFHSSGSGLTVDCVWLALFAFACVGLGWSLREATFDVQTTPPTTDIAMFVIDETIARVVRGDEPTELVQFLSQCRSDINSGELK